MAETAPVCAWDELCRAAEDVHLFEFRSRRFLIDPETASFTELDAPAHFLMSAAQRAEPSLPLQEMEVRFPAVPAEDVLEDLLTLKRQGLLAARRLPAPPRRKAVSTSCLCLILATDCNLRCRYCYAGGGSYAQERRVMPCSVARKAVDFLIRRSGPSSQLGLSFFGGEPLLNQPCLRDAVAYAKQRGQECGKEFSFSLTTNGTLLDDDVADFVAAEGISCIVSLDGPPEVNDRQRVLPDGSGSYAAVIGRLSNALKRHPELRGRMTIRGTFTGASLDLPAYLEHLVELGFPSASLEPCSTACPGLRISEKNLTEVKKAYEDAADWYLRSLQAGQKFSFFHFDQLFQEVATAPRRTRQCGAGSGYLAVDPDGRIFPCHRLVGSTPHAMGTIDEEELNPAIRNLFLNASMPDKATCRQCWARYICGGGCHATAIRSNRDILRPDAIECELMKHRIELGAWIYAELTDQQRKDGV